MYFGEAEAGGQVAHGEDARVLSIAGCEIREELNTCDADGVCVCALSLLCLGDAGQQSCWNSRRRIFFSLRTGNEKKTCGLGLHATTSGAIQQKPLCRIDELRRHWIQSQNRNRRGRATRLAGRKNEQSQEPNAHVQHPRDWAFVDKNYTADTKARTPLPRQIASALGKKVRTCASVTAVC